MMEKQSLINYIRAFFLDGNISYKKRTFVLVLAYTMGACLFSMPFFVYVGAGRETVPVLLGTTLICVFFILAIRRLKADNELIVAFCYVLNIFCIPLVFLVGGGITGGMELLFLPVIMDAFILLSGTLRIVSILIFVVWDTLVVTFTWTHPWIIRNVPEGSNMILSLILSLLTSVYVCLVIVIYQNLLLKDQREKIKQASDAYAADARTKSRFLANMSHELRTPMNAIIGMAELMEKEDVEGAAREEIGVVKNTGESLLMTINDILVFSRLESGKLEMQYEQFSLDTLLSELIVEASRQAQSKGVEIEADLDPQLPNVLYGDDLKIVQVLRNLLINAVESTESGRVTISLHGRKNREGSIVTFSGRITDSGEGLSREDLENIYSSFETYDSKKDSHMKKLGLELTICKGILKMMNGDLTYECLQDVGGSASFYFDCFVADSDPLVNTSIMGTSRVLVASRIRHRRSLWARRLNVFKTVSDFATDRNELSAKLKEVKYDYVFIDDDMFESLRDELKDRDVEKTYVVTDFRHSYGDFDKCRIIRRPVTSLNLGDIFCDRWNEKEYESGDMGDSFVCRGVRVLVVDDNRVNLQVAQAILSKYRITPIPADSGFAALHIVSKAPVDMVFLDQVMPGLDGVGTLAEIRLNKSFAELPVICMTADTEDEARDKLMEKGFSEFISKPIKEKQLEKLLLRFLPKNKIVYKNDASSRAGEGPGADPERTEGAGNARNPSGPENDPHAGGQVFKPEIDMEGAMAMTGGDKDIYHAILNVYLEEGREKLKMLPKIFFGDRDVKLFSIEAHSVKGSSANVGAKSLSEIYKALEMAGKSNDTDYIEQNLGNALNALGMTLDYIRDYLVSQNALERKT